MWENIILGSLQGIIEWLPVSSEGVIFLVKKHFFSTEGETVKHIAQQALFLHFGTFLSALIYFRKRVWEILKIPFKYGKSSLEEKKLFNFLVIATLISGTLGWALISFVSDKLDQTWDNTVVSVTVFIGVLLLITGFLQLKAKVGGLRKTSDLKHKDSVLLGIVQGLAALPGLSRSGLTVSAFLLARFNKRTALVLSFLLSLPIILAGNIILNLDKFNFTWASLLGLMCSFVFGLVTIKLLLKLAEKINFAYFVFIFAGLTFLSLWFI